jgi:hypothetical protein
MIKNIPALNGMILLLVGTLQGSPEIIINDLTPASIDKLHTFASINKGPFTIHVIPPKQWLERVTGFLVSPFVALRNTLTLKNISLTLISGLMSLGWVSYLICAYLIYKTHGVLKNVHSWVNWCSDDELFLDEEVLYQKIEWHKRRRVSTTKENFPQMTLQQEKNLISQYLRLDSFLKIHGVRHYFPHTSPLIYKQLCVAYKKLQKAEELLTLRKKTLLSFAENP